MAGLTPGRRIELMPRAFNNLSSRNKFAKRHYEAIATAIQEARRRASDGDNNHDPITNVVDELCWLFRSDNGQFSRDRFYRACEPGANVRARS